MVAAAAARGYDYVAITDHSKDTRVAGGLDEGRMRAHAARIRRVAEATEGIAVLAGAEVDILKDGRLDFPDSLLRDLDVVVCSVHFRHKLDGRAQTERILRGMSNPNADILGHPTGRRSGIRPGMELDLERIAEAARQQGWCIEMNGSPERLDLDAAGARLAADRGVLVSLDSDAHATWEFAQVENAAREAEKAGLTPEQVLNCLSLEELRRRLER
jgi:DNA polymerase (family 10)